MNWGSIAAADPDGDGLIDAVHGGPNATNLDLAPNIPQSQIKVKSGGTPKANDVDGDGLTTSNPGGTSKVKGEDPDDADGVSTAGTTANP